MNHDPQRLARWNALGSAMFAAGLVAACTALGPPGSAPAPDGTPRPPDQVPQAAPLPTPAPAPAEPPAPPPMSPQEMRTLVEKTVVELLEQGQEEQAAAELQRALRQDPNHRLANSLMRQIREDPQALLGRESFSYRVAPGETLSRIAGRYLGDIYMFYGLARYNNIKVPRQLHGGQQIKIPGKAPAPGTSPPPPPAAPVPVPAAAAAPPAPATPPTPAPPPPDPEAERNAAIARHTRDARAAFARQDLDGAIASWERVLALDPTNGTASFERQRAIDLKERLKKVGR